jgi:hypothetical protein
MKDTSRLLLGAVLFVAVWGCAATEETGSRTGRGGGDPAYVDLRLESPADNVATVQVFRDPNEISLPVIALRADQVLRLEFDLLGKQGKPLRIEFKHLNRRWEDDYLAPSEYMEGQIQDEILDYRRSLAPRSSYFHYSYAFPNASIRFRESGNYKLRVFDPSDGRTMFEAPFLVSEETADMAFELRTISLPGLGGIWNQPVVYIDPEAQPGRDLFDWGACFVRNTRFDLSRCSDRPSLFEAPYASFTVESNDSFDPVVDLHVVDLSELQRGVDIDDVRFESTPIEVTLVPDQADLGGPEVSFQRGQSSISGSVINVGNPDVEAEYVRARFRYIPYRSEQAAGDVIVTGSFNRWVLDAANRLVWNEADGLYEGAILLKQGVHAYQYHVSGPRPSNRGAFAPESSYTALLYYFDPVTQVDRLIAVRSRTAP